MAIKSMTAFGRGRASVGEGFWLVEIKCVNGKFLDCQLRAPVSLNPLEERIKKHAGQQISRGRVNINISLSGAPETQPSLKLNLPLLREYRKIWAELEAELGYKLEAPGLSAFLHNRDLVLAEECAPDAERLWEQLRPALDQALSEAEAMRQAEGRNLSEYLQARLNELERMLGELARLAPRIVEHYHERLQARVARLLDKVELNPERLAQEVALMADRCDISEELVRAASHLQQFRGFLRTPGPVGRKLDFLAQELNREANTMGSKSPDTGAQGLVLDVKAEIEKIREQIQNIE